MILFKLWWPIFEFKLDVIGLVAEISCRGMNLHLTLPDSPHEPVCQPQAETCDDDDEIERGRLMALCEDVVIQHLTSYSMVRHTIRHTHSHPLCKCLDKQSSASE